MDARAVAAELLALADRVERLPGIDRRNPHAFTEGKSLVAADLVALAEILTARRDPPALPLPRPDRPRRPIAILLQRTAPP